MIELLAQNIIVGSLIVLINLIPLIFKKPKYFLLTSIISLVLILILRMIK